MAWKSPGEMEVHVLHRDHLCIAAARGSSLHAERRAEACLAQTDRHLLADPLQPVAKADGGGRLPLARRGRIDGGNQDQPTLRPAVQRRQKGGIQLGLVATVGNQCLRRDADPRADFRGGQLFRRSGDVDIGQHGGVSRLLTPVDSGSGRWRAASQAACGGKVCGGMTPANLHDMLALT